MCAPVSVWICNPLCAPVSVWKCVPICAPVSVWVNVPIYTPVSVWLCIPSCAPVSVWICVPIRAPVSVWICVPIRAPVSVWSGVPVCPYECLRKCPYVGHISVIFFSHFASSVYDSTSWRCLLKVLPAWRPTCHLEKHSTYINLSPEVIWRDISVSIQVIQYNLDVYKQSLCVMNVTWL